ncbi:MAG: hypothetical protein RL139_1108 [Gemmatimonadota bacterium]|jgi:phage tail sheath protein FI
MAHGVSVSEVPTGVRPPVRVTAGLPVYVGTAPVNLGTLVDVVNKPMLFYTLAEYVAKCGPIPPASEWGKWTLAEAASAHFSVYSVAPFVAINVIDPTNSDHYNQLVTEPVVLDANGDAFVEMYGTTTPLYGVIKSTVVVRYGGVPQTLGDDYTLAFDDDGFLVISRVEGGDIPASSTITVSCNYLDPDGVDAADIIGGYSAGVYTGLEVVKQVYRKLRLVPGFILAPKWSQQPSVAARMATIAGNVDGGFRAHALVDLSSDPYEIATHADCAAWKSDNGFNVAGMTPCWPKFKNVVDDVDNVYHLSTVMACRANLTDAARGGIPYASPSNQAITGTSAVLDDDTEVLLTNEQAGALNAQGIVTALNGFNGWRLWGNRTGLYPGNTDPKDAFIPIRRMFNWFQNTVILTTDRDVDQPGNRRLIDSVIGTIGSLINGLIASEAFIDGKIEFREDENPATDLADGIIRWHVTLTPPSPAESINFVLEYDPAALAALFA